MWWWRRAATGARTGAGGVSNVPLQASTMSRTLSPEEVIAGEAVSGPVVVFDDDHYYVGIGSLRASCGARTCRHLCDKCRHGFGVVGAYGRAGAGACAADRNGRQHCRQFDGGRAGAGCGQADLRVFRPDAGDCLRSLCPVTSREPDEALWLALQGRGLDHAVRASAMARRRASLRRPSMTATGWRGVREEGTTIVRRERPLVDRA